MNVVLVDDHAIVRQGLRALLDAQSDIHVIGEAGELQPALDLVAARRPQVLVLDLTLPSGSSLPWLQRFRDASPGMTVVVLTMEADVALAREAMRAGAAAYVLKEGAAAELVSAIRSAADGGRYVSPELAARMAVEPEAGAAAPDGLSPREVEILRLLALGHTNAEVASQLFLSIRTVESHRAHIQQKTGASTRAEIFRYALEHGLVPRTAAELP